MSMQKDTHATGIGYTLKLAQHMLRTHMDDALRSLALTTPQYAVLSQLELSPGISNAALARASFITPQTMHGIISTLEKNNLVKRKSDPHHGRVLCTELTETGRKLVKEAHALIAEVEARMMHGISEKNKLLLEKTLMQFMNNLSSGDK